MRLATFWLFALSLLGSSSAGLKDPLRELVSSERAFASHSVKHGMGPAFLAFLSDDAVLLRPGPVNGKAWMHEHPAPPIILNWDPSFAAVSATGDFGYTTGPYTLRDTVKPGATVRHGNFVSIWKKGRDGAWKVVFDTGTPNPAPAHRVAGFNPDQHIERQAFHAPDTAMQLATLRRSDAAIAALTMDAAGVDRMLSMFDTHIRLFRPGQFPVIGIDSARARLAAGPEKITLHPLFADVARSGDMAYSYGTITRHGSGEEREGHYLHVWVLQEKKWMIALELTTI